MKNVGAGFKGAWITEDILFATDIGPAEKMLLVLIQNLVEDEEGCTPYNTYLAQYLGTDVKTAVKYLKSLEDCGYVRMRYKNPTNSTGRSIHVNNTRQLKFPEYKNLPKEHRLSEEESQKLKLEEEQKRIEQQKHEDSFNEFWELYPRKEKKVKAREQWMKMNGEREDIIRDLKRRVWTDDTTYIPHPTTYLNSKVWEDDLLSSDKGMYGSMKNAI